MPKFNPARLLMDNGRGNAVPADDTPGAEPDAEVSFVTRDLASVLPRVKVAAAVPLEDVIARVRDAAEWTGSVARPMTASLDADSYPEQLAPQLCAGRRRGRSLCGLRGAHRARRTSRCCRRAPKQNDGPNAWNERLVVVKKDESAATILRDQGASPEDIRNLTAVLGARGRDGGLREGQKLRILFAPDAGRLRVVRVIVVGEAVEAVVALSDTGKYVAVDVQSMAAATEVAEADEDDENDTAAVRLYQSIYETALRNQIPRPVIDDLVRIYSYDVDFQRRAQPGDSFEVLFSGEEEQGATNDVLFAALTVGGETKKFYRYLSPDDGVVDYYDETGKSAKKFLVRKPVGLGIMRSGFGFRRHPILGYSKMHTGVDWAAPYGTPIFSSGNGTVEQGRLGRRLRQIRAREAQQRLRDRLRPHVGLRARHRAGQARAPGPGDRLRRLDRPLDRRARALRDRGQRPLRRPDAHPPAARPRARRPDPRGLRERARPRRRHDAAQGRCGGLRRTRASGGERGHQLGLTSLQSRSFAAEGER